MKSYSYFNPEKCTHANSDKLLQMIVKLSHIDQHLGIDILSWIELNILRQYFIPQ